MNSELTEAGLGAICTFLPEIIVGRFASQSLHKDGGL